MRPQRETRFSKLSRRHFLKYALSAIYRLGSKSLRKAINPARSNAAHERRLSKKRRYDDEFPTTVGTHEAATRDPILPGIELDGTAVGGASSCHLDAMMPTELPCSRRTRLFEMDAFMPRATEHATAELASKRFSTASSESAVATTVSASSTSSPVSPVTSDHFFSSKDFDSPISPADVSDLLQWPSEIPLSAGTTSSRHESIELAQATGSEPSHNVWASVGARAATRSHPRIRIDTSCAVSHPTRKASPQFENLLCNTPSPLAIESRTQSPVKLVEELRGLFNTNYRISYAKLIQPPPCPMVTSSFEGNHSAASMFKSGWEAVLKFVNGKIPDTFSEVFAITHLGYACALTVQEADLVNQLPHVFNDLIKWSNAISIGEDRLNYLDLIQKLFSPQITDTEFSGSSDATLLGMGQSTPGDIDQILPLGREDAQALYNTLKTGPTIRLCVQYLESE